MPDVEIDTPETDLVELDNAMTDSVAGGAGKADLVNSIAEIPVRIFN